MQNMKSKNKNLRLKIDRTPKEKIYSNQSQSIFYDNFVEPDDLPVFVLEINERNANCGETSGKSGNRSVVVSEKCFVSPEPGTTNDLTVGSLVEIINDDVEDPLYGVIRWLGQDVDTHLILVGIELEDDHSNLSLTLSDGTYNGVKYFDCPIKKGVFVSITQCRKDSRFQDGTPTPVHAITEKMFGKVC